MRRIPIVLAALLGGTLQGCSSDPQGVSQRNYTLRWEFSSSIVCYEGVTFRGEEHGDLTAPITLTQSMTDWAVTTDRPYTTPTTEVRVTVTDGGSGSKSLTGVAVAAGKTTRIIASWDGTTLSVTSLPPGQAPSLSVVGGNPARVCTSPVHSVTVTPGGNLTVGATRQMVATLRDAQGIVVTRFVDWQSALPSVASITSTGLVTAVAPGTTTIRATSEQVIGEISLTVVAPPPTLTTWTLTGVSGATSGNWSVPQQAAFTGSLVFNPPQQVQEGQTYQLSAAFTGTVAAQPGFTPYSWNIASSIRDESTTFGFFVAEKFAQLLGNPNAAATADAAGAWTIPASYHGLATLTLIGRGGGSFFDPLIRTATYTKAP